jgi:predicted nucleotidyltransferase
VNTAGWAVMIVSVGAVLVLSMYCVVKVLSLPPVEMEDLHGPLDIDTRDTKDAD